MSTKYLFGSAIAVILLVVYVYLVFEAGSVAGCTPVPECHAAFTDRMASTMALIGGLIAALVVAELTATKPGQVPGSRALSSDPTGRLKTATTVLTLAYLGVWILAGLYAFLVGLRSSDVLEPLNALGQSWLGIAVAAAYSYFGIEQKP